MTKHTQNTDSITLLLKARIESGDGRFCKRARMRKEFTREGDGWSKQNPEFANRFSVIDKTVCGIDDLHAVLDDVAEFSDACVIRGETREGFEWKQAEDDQDWRAGAFRVARKKYKGEDDPRLNDSVSAQPWFFEGDRRWVMLDIDDLPGTHSPEDVRAMLPRAFHGVRCRYDYSASHGVKDGTRLHLWFWLNRAVCNASFKEWVESWTLKVDTLLFNAVQVHYTAAPAFFDEDGEPLADILETRSGILDGGSDEVALPAHVVNLEEWEAGQAELEAKRQAEREAKTRARKRVERRTGRALDLREATPAQARGAIEHAVDALQRAPEGSRHPTLYAKAAWLAETPGVDVDEARRALSDAICTVFEPSRWEKEERTLDDAIETGLRSRSPSKVAESIRPDLREPEVCPLKRMREEIAQACAETVSTRKRASNWREALEESRRLEDTDLHHATVSGFAEHGVTTLGELAEDIGYAPTFGYAVAKLETMIGVGWRGARHAVMLASGAGKGKRVVLAHDTGAGKTYAARKAAIEFIKEARDSVEFLATDGRVTITADTRQRLADWRDAIHAETGERFDIRPTRASADKVELLGGDDNAANLGWFECARIDEIAVAERLEAGAGSAICEECSLRDTCAYIAARESYDERQAVAFHTHEFSARTEGFFHDTVIVDESPLNALLGTVTLTSAHFEKAHADADVTAPDGAMLPREHYNALRDCFAADKLSPLQVRARLAGVELEAPHTHKGARSEAVLTRQGAQTEDVDARFISHDAKQALVNASRNGWRGVHFKSGKMTLPVARKFKFRAYADVLALDATCTPRLARALYGDDARVLSGATEHYATVVHYPRSLSSGDYTPGGWRRDASRAHFECFVDEARRRSAKPMFVVHKKMLEDDAGHVRAYLADELADGRVTHFESVVSRGSNEFIDRDAPIDGVYLLDYYVPRNVVESYAQRLEAMGVESAELEAQFQKETAPVLQAIGRLRANDATLNRGPLTIGYATSDILETYPPDETLDAEELFAEKTGADEYGAFRRDFVDLFSSAENGANVAILPAKAECKGVGVIGSNIYMPITPTPLHFQKTLKARGSDILGDLNEGQLSKLLKRAGARLSIVRTPEGHERVIHSGQLGEPMLRRIATEYQFGWIEHGDTVLDFELERAIGSFTSEAPSVSSLAEVLGVSRPTVNKRIRRLTSVHVASPAQWVRAKHQSFEALRSDLEALNAGATECIDKLRAAHEAVEATEAKKAHTAPDSHQRVDFERQKGETLPERRARAAKLLERFGVISTNLPPELAEHVATAVHAHAGTIATPDGELCAIWRASTNTQRARDALLKRTQTRTRKRSNTAG